MNSPIDRPGMWDSISETVDWLVVFIGVIFFMFLPVTACSNLQQNARDREKTQLVANFAQQGFPLSEQQASDVLYRERLDLNVGSCELTVFVDDSDNNYRAYLQLNDNIKRYVTMESLEKLDKTRQCFG